MLKVSYCDQSMSVVRRASSVMRRQYFTLKAHYSKIPRPIDMKLGRKHRSDFYKKKLKSFRFEIQNGRYRGHLENLFFGSSPEQKGQLT